MLEGPVAVREAQEAGLELSDLFTTEEAASSVEGLGVGALCVTEQVMRAISDATTPQGVVAIARMPDATLEDVIDGDLLMVLAEVRDPGNAGTLVRSALAAGAAGVVFTKGSVDPFGPKTVRSSAGSVVRTPIVRDVELTTTLDRLKGEGFAILAASSTAGTTVDEVDLTGRVAFVLGNEAWGLPEEMAALVDTPVGISMPGPVESLNVAVAGSILLFECVRQRRAGA